MSFVVLLHDVFTMDHEEEGNSEQEKGGFLKELIPFCGTKEMRRMCMRDNLSCRKLFVFNGQEILSPLYGERTDDRVSELQGVRVVSKSDVCIEKEHSWSGHKNYGSKGNNNRDRDIKNDDATDGHSEGRIIE